MAPYKDLSSIKLSWSLLLTRLENFPPAAWLFYYLRHVIKIRMALVRRLIDIDTA